MENIKSDISKMVQSAYDGNESSALVFANLKNLKDQIESGIEVVKSLAIEEARSFNDEIYYGGKWQIKSGATYLDFSKDETFTRLNKLALARKKDLNLAYKQNILSKCVFDSESGEEIPVLPVKSLGSEILIFKAN